VDFFIELVKGSPQIDVIPRLLGHDLHKPRAQKPIIGASTEERGSPALSCHPIAMSSWNAFDQAVQAKAA